MTEQQTVTGMVLSTMPIGEYDKRLVILTKERGKISVFARGARRPNSALLACSQPFVFGKFYLYIGRDSYTTTAAEISNYFSELRKDLDSVYYGFYFCEFADFLTRENMQVTEILKLLYQSFCVLSKKIINPVLVRYIFELKIIALNGEAPQVFECIKCKKQKKEYWFSAENGGLICNDCISTIKKARKLQDSTIYTMQFIIATSIEKLFTFMITDRILEELGSCITKYLKIYIAYTFKSLEVLDSISKNI